MMSTGFTKSAYIHHQKGLATPGHAWFFLLNWPQTGMIEKTKYNKYTYVMNFMNLFGNNDL